MNGSVTLNRFILATGATADPSRAELAELLNQTAFAAKVIAREVRRAALVGRLGLVGEKNPTGDAQKKLDVFANQVFFDAFAGAELVAGIVSEEVEAISLVACNERSAYILCVDPLDGSSNSDNNGSVGTLFAFYRRRSTCGCEALEEELGGGAQLVAAGYVMYGPSTVLAYSLGAGVQVFTLDHDLGEFLLSHENLRCPESGHGISVNLGNSPEWDPRVRDHVASLVAGEGGKVSFRYAGAMVADLHRCLLEGGIYLYPADRAHPKGKLRLLYECAPAAFLAEQAGGAASTGTGRILDLRPASLHATTPLAIGSRENVARFERALATAGPPETGT